MKMFFIEILPIITSLYLLYSSVMLSTENYISGLIFKFIPLLLAVLLSVPILAKYLV